jgi:hypothetical protein
MNMTIIFMNTKYYECLGPEHNIAENRDLLKISIKLLIDLNFRPITGELRPNLLFGEIFGDTSPTIQNPPAGRGRSTTGTVQRGKMAILSPGTKFPGIHP